MCADSKLDQLLDPGVSGQSITCPLTQKATMEGGHSRAAAPSYLAWSIINTLCCCLPIGIAAIVYSSRVQNANASGDTVAAEDASRTAKILNIVGLVCGIILIIVFIAIKASGG